MVGGSIPAETRTASIAIFSEVEALNYANAYFYSGVLFLISFGILFALNFMNRKGFKVIS
jgi:molybdate transport system permease protein